MHMHTCGNCGTEYTTGSCWYCHPQNRAQIGSETAASMYDNPVAAVNGAGCSMVSNPPFYPLAGHRRPDETLPRLTLFQLYRRWDTPSTELHTLYAGVPTSASRAHFYVMMKR